VRQGAPEGLTRIGLPEGERKSEKQDTGHAGPDRFPILAPLGGERAVTCRKPTTAFPKEYREEFE
jgi:hypothetical protein